MLENSQVKYNAESTRFSWLKCMKGIRSADLKSTKCLLLSITAIFAITGLSLLIVGIDVLAECNKYDMFVGVDFFALPRFVITTAVFIFSVAAFGFYAAKSEKYKLVRAYAMLLVAILVFVIAIPILANKLQSYVYMDIYFNMRRNNPFTSNIHQTYVSATWDDMHTQLRCCGFNRNSILELDTLPISCCPIPAGALSPFECTIGNAYRGDCDRTLAGMMKNNAYKIEVTGAIVACLQVIIIGVTCWIVYRMKHKREIPLDGCINRDTIKLASPNPVVVDFSKY